MTSPQALPSRHGRLGYPSRNHVSGTIILKDLVHIFTTSHYLPMKQNQRHIIQKAYPTVSRNTEHGARRFSRRQAIVVGTSAATGVLIAPTILAAAEKRKVVVWSEGTANVDS